MKSKSLYLLLVCASLLVFSTCKKDTDVNMDTFKIVKEVEKITVGTTTATITGMYDFSGRIDGIKVRVGTSDQLFGSDVYVAEMSGKSYSVSITGLRSGTKYHYRYEVDYGAKEDYLTEINDFTTQSESPTVRTLEVQAIDSTTFRVKCIIDADGGSEVTECGICWNVYGDPTPDDETLQYANGVVGQPYTLRLENLSSSTRYFVCAYAKNASGLGLGEVLDFRTGGETTKPQVSTVEVSTVSYNTAICLSNVSSDGGLELTERGVCWGLEPDPTVNVHKVPAEGTETGNYTVTIEGLNPNTDYHVRAYAINEKGIAYGEDLPFTTTDGKPTVTTSAVTDITATSATGGGNVTDEGASPVTERGICWSTNHEPTTNGSHASSGTGSGSYACNMTSLVPNETYYVRAFATNGQGTAYGAEVEFIAREGMPVVATLDVTDITATGAKAHGKVSNQGGSTVTERGICWRTEPSPTINGSHAHSGTGAGEYTVDMTGLAPGTKYYVRAYAINAQGMTYGGQEDFTTEATLPTVATGSINGTTVSGEVTSEGGATVTERGVCWSTSHTPTLDGSHGSSGSGLGTFSVALTDLAPGTTYYVRAYATNSAGTAYGSEKTLTTEANLPTVTTGEVTNIGQNTAQGSGNVTDSGGAMVTERGICWSTSHNPTINGSHANSGTGMGGFTVSMTGLTANTHYYVRAYAKNSAGVSYGNEVDFTTSQNTSAPTVTTSQVTNITQTTATGGGNVTSDGGATVTERGICWSTSHNPTTSGSHASNGTGTGSYTVNMTGLTPGTQYYVRAYAVNSEGTSYGSEVSFTTQQAITVPSVTTIQVTNIQQTSATGGGNVTSDGGATVTERGICWSTSHNPTTSGSHASNGTGTGSYTVNMTGLTPGTQYYVRAYAINSEGTSYGSEVSFTTQQVPTYTISVYANPTNGGSVTGGGTYNYGVTVNLTANANSGFTFDHWQDGNTNNPRTITVTGNATYTAYFNAQPQAPEGAINGLFTINANGDQVYFSQGNLQYQASTNTWRFASNQYDYVGNDNSNISQSYSGWIDLFGWGTSGWDCGNTYYRPWDSYSGSDWSAGSLYGPPGLHNLTGSYAHSDWGIHNAISNGGNTAGQWRTLTRDESEYLFFYRNTPSGIYYVKAKVNGVNGVILLPDDWDSSYYSLNYINDYFYGQFNSNVINSSAWTNSFQSHGAVFLPAAGYRLGTSLDGVGSYGWYWLSSSCSSDHEAFNLYFYNGTISPEFTTNRRYGCSVRLVHPVQRQISDVQPR